MIFAAVLAGGTGSRMKGAAMPKQFLPLGGEPVIIRTLRPFLALREFDRIFIGIHPQWAEHMSELAARFFPDDGRLSLICGGGERTDTLLAVIAQIERQYGARDHILVTHDGVRPFVTQRVILENIACARQYGACGTAVPCTDTLVFTKTPGVMEHMPDRSGYYRMQTPQTFRLDLLQRAYGQLNEEQKRALTDACGVFVRQGLAVHIVEGDAENMKITTQGDYRMAQALARFEQEEA